MRQAAGTARRTGGRGIALALAAALLILAVATASAQARAKWDIRLLAHVPSPGYPGLSLVAPDRTIYVGTFTNAEGSPTGPAKVFAYSPEGTLERTYTISGEDPSKSNGVQVAARDANGLLYLLDQNPARVVVLDPRTGSQSTYASFHDVKPCGQGGPPGNCSNTVQDNLPEPDYAAWATDGSMYVTDYQQGLIWRVPPGGGNATVWFTDPQLDGSMFGPAQIVLLPDHRTLMLDTSAGGVTTPGNATTGKLYTLPIQADGRPGALHKVWESGPREGPDGFALAASGNVYMALVGPGTNQLVEIAPNGTELGRAPSAAQNSQMNPPFDEPSSVAFDGDRMIVTNDPYFDGNTAHMVLFDVWAGEPGAPIYLPPASVTPGESGAIAGLTSVVSRDCDGGFQLAVTPHRVRAGRRHRYRFRALSCVGGYWRPLAHAVVFFDGHRLRTNAAGTVAITVRLGRSGRYLAWLLRGRRALDHAVISARR